jgi:hypothetical protein
MRWIGASRQQACLAAGDMGADSEPKPIRAGVAASPLIADPTTWINRRVETIELLAREETRRRVSIDFTLSDAQLDALSVEDGVVVPIAVLAKERRKAFDLCDEGGAAIPVLGREQNGTLSLVAVLSAAQAALPAGVPDEELEALTVDLRRIVMEPAASAEEVRADFARKAATEGSCHAIVNADPVGRALLDALWTNYVLFAVLPEGGPNRRIIKYAYSDDIDFSTAATRLSERLTLAEVFQHVRYPDRRRFLIDCPSAWRAKSFHAEIVIPEELRFDYAVLYDFARDMPVSDAEGNVNRAALYPDEGLDAGQEVVAAVNIAPEGPGRLDQAATTSLLVSALLWLGVVSGLDADSPDAAVSLLLGGAALFSGVTAVSGEHRLVRMMFSATRRWLLVVTAAALAASASLAMEVPDESPLQVWWAAAALCTIAGLRLVWSSIRARA